MFPVITKRAYSFGIGRQRPCAIHYPVDYARPLQNLNFFFPEFFKYFFYVVCFFNSRVFLMACRVFFFFFFSNRSLRVSLNGWRCQIVTRLLFCSETAKLGLVTG